MRKKVLGLLASGLTAREVADVLGVNKSTVAYHARRSGLEADVRFSVRYDWAEIRAAYESGLSMRECLERFGFSRDTWAEAVRRGDIVPRPRAAPIDEILVAGRAQGRCNIKRRLLAEGLKENVCEECGVSEWRGRPLNLQLHHKNGDPNDNRLENLALLCPNCHSQTDTYGGRNGHRRMKSAGPAVP